MPTLDAWGTTDAGLVRRNNEDNWVVEPELCLAVVADGMGGAACGEIASSLTVETVRSYLHHPAEDLLPEQLLREAIREANRQVRERARAEAACDGMASTIVAAFWYLPQVVVANVGDSRAYLWRDGRLTQLTYDQTLANELRRSLHLSDDEVAGYTHKNVLTMAVGSSDEVLIQVRLETLAPGDRLLLCSDGLHGMVPDPTLAGMLRKNRPLRPTVEEMVEGAKAAGGEDNITAVLLEWASGTT